MNDLFNVSGVSHFIYTGPYFFVYVFGGGGSEIDPASSNNNVLIFDKLVTILLFPLATKQNMTNKQTGFQHGYHT